MASKIVIGHVSLHWVLNGKRGEPWAIAKIYIHCNFPHHRFSRPRSLYFILYEVNPKNLSYSNVSSITQ